MAKFFLTLVILGSLNWLSIGLFNVNFVRFVTTMGNDYLQVVGPDWWSWTNLVYVLVGIAGLYCFKLYRYLPDCCHHDHDDARRHNHHHHNNA